MTNPPHRSRRRKRRSIASEYMPALAMMASALLATVVVALSLVRPVGASFSMVVESATEECFVVRAPGQKGRLSTISGNYDCLDDGIPPSPVSVTLYDPRMRPVWKSRPSASEGTFSVVGQGRYQLCISNGVNPKKPDGMDRKIGFAVRVRDMIRQKEMKEEEKKEEEKKEDEENKSRSVEKAGEMAGLTEQLIERLHTLTDHQGYLRERESAHRDLAESTFNLLLRWTFVEAAVLVIVAGGQVMYLRKFFETRRYL